jgi:hypothetical protein
MVRPGRGVVIGDVAMMDKQDGQLERLVTRLFHWAAIRAMS